MIQHSVIFTLKHPSGSNQEAEFLEATKILADIPQVRNLRCLRQTSPKNHYSFGLSMEFVSDEDFQAYMNHPIHKDFVESKWIPEVSDFLEIDYVPYETK